MLPKRTATQPSKLSHAMALVLLGLWCSANASAADVATDPVRSVDGVRAKELVTLVRQDCGSCHGMTLKGGLGPALLPDALKDKPVENLTFVILHGRPGTAMPPWQRFLTNADAEWIVNQLQKGFPSER